jgi:hypothetical protein
MEDWIDEAISREDWGEDPRAEASPLPEEVRLKERHPAGVELHLFTRCAVGNGHGRSCAAETEFSDGESAQRRVGDRAPCRARSFPILESRTCSAR